MPKYNTSKKITKHLRSVVLYNAHKDFTGEGNFMTLAGDFEKDVDAFFNDTDMFPMHFLMHLFHAAEIIGYKHPDPATAGQWQIFYERACDSFHMNPESMDQLDARLCL